jgi:hypothetical protein
MVYILFIMVSIFDDFQRQQIGAKDPTAILQRMARMLSPQI